MEKILFIFELDFTLWNCGEKPHDRLKLPLEKHIHTIKDNAGKIISSNPEILRILDEIKESGYQIAFVSSTTNPECTHRLMSLFGFDNYSNSTCFDNASRQEQIKTLMESNRVNPNHTIYFDSSKSHIESIQQLNVLSFLIPDNGLTYDTFLLAMKNASMKIEINELKIIWGSK